MSIERCLEECLGARPDRPMSGFVLQMVKFGAVQAVRENEHIAEWMRYQELDPSRSDHALLAVAVSELFARPGSDERVGV